MRYVGKNQFGEISQLWGVFNHRIKEIPNLSKDPDFGDVAYGLCSCMEGAEPGVFEYIACLPVSTTEEVPEGMVGKTVPEQTYAVVQARGINEIGRTYEFIIKEWLPSSGFFAGNGPDFEFYPEDVNLQDPESPVLIFFPVEKRVKGKSRRKRPVVITLPGESKRSFSHPFFQEIIIL